MPIDMDFSGQTLVAGAYSQAGACTANLPVTLDCAGSQTGFSFTIGGALSINTDIQFKDNHECPVHWQVGGAVAMTVVAPATSARIAGNFDSVGAITVVANVFVSGYVHSSAGAVTVSPFGSVKAILPA
jgi:hypothetical protein